MSSTGAPPSVLTGGRPDARPRLAGRWLGFAAPRRRPDAGLPGVSRSTTKASACRSRGTNASLSTPISLRGGRQLARRRPGGEQAAPWVSLADMIVPHDSPSEERHPLRGTPGHCCFRLAQRAARFCDRPAAVVSVEAAGRLLRHNCDHQWAVDQIAASGAKRSRRGPASAPRIKGSFLRLRGASIFNVAMRRGGPDAVTSQRHDRQRRRPPGRGRFHARGAGGPGAP
jgi:hypothetical protein